MCVCVIILLPPHTCRELWQSYISAMTGAVTVSVLMNAAVKVCLVCAKVVVVSEFG